MWGGCPAVDVGVGERVNPADRFLGAIGGEPSDPEAVKVLPVRALPPSSLPRRQMFKSATYSFLLLAAVLTSFQAHAATAYWTGAQRQVTTVTYQMVWECEYNYQGRVFTRLFQTSCPSSIEVQ
jgi:hypothetical protein